VGGERRGGSKRVSRCWAGRENWGKGTWEGKVGEGEEKVGGMGVNM